MGCDSGSESLEDGGGVAAGSLCVHETGSWALQLR